MEFVPVVVVPIHLTLSIHFARKAGSLFIPYFIKSDKDIDNMVVIHALHSHR